MGYPISFILGLLLRYAVCLGNRVTVADVVLGDRSTAWPPVWKTEAGNSSRLGGVLERSYSDWVQDGPRSTGIDLPAVLAFLARRKWCIAVPVVLAAVGCWLVATSLPPVFSAQAVLVLDTRDFEVVQIDTVVSRLPRDDATLRSQLDLITSRSMAERVVDRLDLTQTDYLKDVMASEPVWHTVVERLAAPLASIAPSVHVVILRLLETEMPPSGPPSRIDAAEYLLNGLQVSNDGRSYTIFIRFTSPDQVYSALIANAFAEEYLAYQIDIKATAAEDAAAWLSDRVAELRVILAESEQAVETYRHEIGLLEVYGEPLEDNRLTIMDQQMIEARAERIAAEARLQTARDVLLTGGNLGSVGEIMNAQFLSALRQQEGQLRADIADASSQFGERHPRVVALSESLAEVESQIADETALILRNLTDRVNVARAREADLQQAVTEREQQHWSASGSAVRLRQLIREADANRAIYETFINRYKEMIEQVDLQRPEGQIISWALPPTKPDRSTLLPILLIGSFGGLLCGLALGVARDRLDQSVRRVEDAETCTRLPVLGLVPALTTSWHRQPETYVVRHPNSRLGEALRASLIAMVQSSGGMSAGGSVRPHVMMVTSAVPREGKTSYCLSLARLAAADGQRVLLIDADLRVSRLSRRLGTPSTPPGDLIDLLTGAKPFNEVVQTDALSGAQFLSGRPGFPKPHVVLAAPAFQHLIHFAATRYDLVIIDTPPILSATDAAIVGVLADVSVYIIRWGSTAREAVLAGLRRLGLCGVTLNGVVLSRVNLRRHQRYPAGEAYCPSQGTIIRR